MRLSSCGHILSSHASESLNDKKNLIIPNVCPFEEMSFPSFKIFFFFLPLLFTFSFFFSAIGLLWVLKKEWH
jgi:membrane protein insertase Oxa1/YidC/SpoIIIJ